MKRMLLRVMSLMLTAVMLFGLGNSFPALAMEDGDTLGTSVACEGHTLGTFSGVPACVNENGDLHLCEKIFLMKILGTIFLH